jgi:acyl-homoserine-lactone acylase
MTAVHAARRAKRASSSAKPDGALRALGHGEEVAMTLRSRFEFIVGMLAWTVLGGGCANGEDAPPESDEAVFVRYTEYGVPHVRERDYESVGFGQGYAQARDNLCQIERGMIALRGELSRWFGPEAFGTTLSSAKRSLDSDFYFGGIVERGVVEQLIARPPPLGPRDEVRDIVRGYVAGFNRVLAENNSFECSGAPWVQSMTELDVYRRVYAITTLMDQAGIFATGMISATPPAQSASVAPMSPASPRYAGPGMSLPGSNAIALGSEMTANGGGISLANPHLDWHGDMRWYINHLAIPDTMDVSGATIIGMPLVVMGHTRTVAWSITTAEKTRHSTIYDLTLSDDLPTTYLVDGKPEPMEAVVVKVKVKQEDGSLETLTRTQWWTRYGAVLGPTPVPLPEWTAGGADEPGHAYALADANASNMRMLNMLFAFNHAQTTDDILTALRTEQAAPWWTVVAADARGETLWSQIQVVPNVSDELLERCSTEYGKALFGAARFIVLDGSRSDCAWEDSPDAVQPGTFGPGDGRHPKLPFAVGSEYFENSNDSHWLPNAMLRISGMPGIVGDEETPRSLRTRGLIAELDAQRGKRNFTRERMQDTMTSNRSYAAELALDQTVALCRGLDAGTAVDSEGKRVDVREACEVLASWNGRMDKDSRGALLFSRFWTLATALTAEDDSLWSVGFDPNDPVATPNTLNASNPLIAQALADAVFELERAGMAIDTKLGDHQFVVRDDERIPLGGGTDELGVVNLLHAEFTADGFTEPLNGSTYMHVVELGDRCPSAGMMVTYSQSSEPSSPHHRDLTDSYSNKRWIDERFCEEDIVSSPALEIVEVTRAQ